MSVESTAVGLCAGCRFGIRQRSARGQVFWRCRLADSDPRYRRYPPLPVQHCSGHVRGEPERRGESR